MSESAPPSLNRYHDVQYVGEGAFGRVWRAVRDDGREAAIKVLAPGLLARPEAVWRFGGEYRRLQALRHPAFPEAFEEGLTADGRPFYAMAFLPGAPLQGPVAPALAREVLAGVAQALAYLHGTGLVHGDLKADNVLLAPEGSAAPQRGTGRLQPLAGAGGRVRVLDVGTASPIGQIAEEVGGTLEYMAPEVLHRAEAAPAADWYAVGVLGYYLLAGRTPFVAGPGGPSALVRAQLFDAPPALPPGADPALAAAVTGLLAKDPARREAALAPFFEALGLPRPAASAAGLRGGAWIPRPAVEAAGAALLAGDRDVALVGPAGAGKSRSLDALRLAARLDGRTWLAAACEGAGDAPGAVVRAVLRQALAQAGRAPGEAVAAWLDGRLLPSWLDLEPRARKLALARAIAEAWRGVVEALGRPVVALDDWQRADAASAELIAELRAAGGAAGGARWCFATEGEPPVDAEAFALDAWAPADVAALVAARLGVVAGAAGGAGVDSGMGSGAAAGAAAAGEAPPPSLLDALAKAGATLPGLIDALLEHAVTERALRHEAGAWRFDADAAAGGEGDPWARLWAAKVARLPEPALALARVAAAARAAGPLPAAALGRAAGLADRPLQAALDAAVAAGVLAEAGAGVRFAAAPVAESLAAELPAPVRAAALAGLARDLLGMPASPGTASPGAASPGTASPGAASPGPASPGPASPASGSSAPGATAPGATAPGAAASGSSAPGSSAPGAAAPAGPGTAGSAPAGSPAGAAAGPVPGAAAGAAGAAAGTDALADAALAAVPFPTLLAAATLAAGGDDDALAVALAGAAASRALELMALDDARRILDGARARLTDAVPADRRGALFLAGAEAARLSDRQDEAAADYEAVLAIAADGRTRALAGLGLAKARQLRGRYDEALAQATGAEAAAREARDGNLAARAAVVRARVELFSGSPARAREACAEAVQLTASGGSPAVRSAALNLWGVLLVGDDPAQGPTALGMIRQAIALAEGVGDLVGVAAALENLGNAHLALGELAEAKAAFQRCAEHCKAHGIATEALSADMNLALVLAERGETEPALALAADVEARAAALARSFIRVIILAVRGQALWRAGRPAEAAPALDASLALAQEIKNRFAEEYVRMYRLEAWIALGDLDRADAEADAAQAVVDATDHAEGRVKLAALRVALAALRGDLAAATAAAAPLAGSLNRTIAHAAAYWHAVAALRAGDAEAAHTGFERALAHARAWAAPWHVAASALGLARSAPDAESAAEWAREALTAGENAWAAAGAAALLASRGRPLSGNARLALAELAAGLAGLDADARARALAANDLAPDALAGDGAAPAAAGGVDVAAIAPWHQGLLAASDEPAVHERLLAAVVALVRADRGYLLSYERGRLREAVTLGVDYEAEVAQGFSSSITEEVMWTGEPVYLIDASADAHWRASASVQDLGLRTVLALPYGTPRQLLGVVYVDRAALTPELAPGDLRALRLLADLAADRVLAMRAALDAAHELAFRGTLADAAIHVAGLPQASRRAALLDVALRMTGARRAFWLAAGAGGGWEARAARGDAAFDPARVSRSVLARVMETREPECLVETDRPEGWTPGTSVLALGIRMVWCLPVSAGEAIYLDADRLDAPDPRGLTDRLAQLFARLGPLLGEDLQA